MSKNVAEAGRRGDDVRSDAWMRMEILESGGILLDFQSRVESLYGDSSRKLLLSGLEHFGIENVTLSVEDKGALPFVLMARLESAIRRLFPEEKITPWLPEQFENTVASERRRQRRSRLYLPGNESKFIINASLHNPDAIILDLEDSVAPPEKDAAQVLVRNALLNLDFGNCEKMVRINQGARGISDLEFIVPFGVQLILIPKVESADQVVDVAEKIAEIQKTANTDYPIWLMPIIESAKGAWFAYDIAASHHSIVSLAIGLEDYTADIGAQRTDEGRESFWARSQVVNAARAAGVQPIDTVYSDVSNLEKLEEAVLEAKSMGFEGKGCIHPRQIDVVHQGFAPTEVEIDKAVKITLAFDKAEREGKGVVSLGSKMIDPPVVKRALRTITQAENEGKLKPGWRDQ
ncbi:aldolase/citrate lyase family protein [Calditrichota bacterium]